MLITESLVEYSMVCADNVSRQCQRQLTLSARGDQAISADKANEKPCSPRTALIIHGFQQKCSPSYPEAIDLPD